MLVWGKMQRKEPEMQESKLPHTYFLVFVVLLRCWLITCELWVMCHRSCAVTESLNDLRWQMPLTFLHPKQQEVVWPKLQSPGRAWPPVCSSASSTDLRRPGQKVIRPLSIVKPSGHSTHTDWCPERGWNIYVLEKHRGMLFFCPHNECSYEAS